MVPVKCPKRFEPRYLQLSVWGLIRHVALICQCDDFHYNSASTFEDIMQSRLSIVTSSLWGILGDTNLPSPALPLSKLLFSPSRLFKPYSRLFLTPLSLWDLLRHKWTSVNSCSVFYFQTDKKIWIVCFGGKSTFLWTCWNDSSSRDQLAQRAGHFLRADHSVPGKRPS